MGRFQLVRQLRESLRYNEIRLMSDWESSEFLCVRLSPSSVGRTPAQADQATDAQAAVSLWKLG